MIIIVLDGNVEDKISGTVLKKGEILITPPKQLHEIFSIGGESYLYMMMCSDATKLKISEEDLVLSKIMLNKD